MELKFYGEIEGLEEGISILSNEYDFKLKDSGLNVNVYKTQGNIEVGFKNGQGYIGYDKKIHFFRALGLFLESMKDKNDFKIIEEPQFDSNGAMFDCSRNGVLTVKSIKEIISKMAIMGLNTFMLYTEDTYEVKDIPYFGYMRGRYSHDELKECDDYANVFGIEMIPCIQTLAHLTHALKWKYGEEVKDTRDILLVGEEKTYDFIEKMITAAIEPFRTKRIHIGMDEAHNLGLGNYLKKNGYKNKLELMNEHITRVLEITEKYNLKPMIWSDMYSWNVTEEDDLENLVPKNLKLVYWDYYNHSENSYAAHIKKHRRFGSDPIYAGGIWTWIGMGTWYNKTFATMDEALRACKKSNLKEVFATMWGDNGTEVNILSGLLGLQYFAEQGYEKNLNLDMEKLKKRFEFCVKADYQGFRDLTLLDEPLGEYNPNYYYNPSKCILWQDLLMGLFDKHFQGIDLKTYYENLEKKMNIYVEKNKQWDFIFKVPEKLCKVLKQKGDMGIRIKKYYDNKDLKELNNLVEVELTELYKNIDALRLAHRNQWFKSYKAFGWEVLDIRYGGLLARVNSTRDRLKDFIEGRVDNIEELEQERLYFDGEKNKEDFKLPFCNDYLMIISANTVLPLP